MFVGNFHLGRKDRIWQHLHAANFDIMPQSFVLPHDTPALRAHLGGGGQKERFVIVKPVSGGALEQCARHTRRRFAARIGAWTWNLDRLAHRRRAAGKSAHRPALHRPAAHNRRRKVRREQASKRASERAGKRASERAGKRASEQRLKTADLQLRLYVGVTSLEPLRIYLYKDGLVRLASAEYSRPRNEAQKNNQFAHLTNFSLVSWRQPRKTNEKLVL